MSAPPPSTITLTEYCQNNFPKLINLSEGFDSSRPKNTGCFVGTYIDEENGDETYFAPLYPTDLGFETSLHEILTGSNEWTSNWKDICNMNVNCFVSNHQVLTTNPPAQFAIQGYCRKFDSNGNTIAVRIEQAAPTLSNRIEIIDGQVTDNQWISSYRESIQYLAHTDQAMTLTDSTNNTIQLQAGYSFVTIANPITASTAGNAVLLPMNVIYT